MEPPKEVNHLISNFLNNVLNDMKNLTNSLKSLSKPTADVNNALINKLLLANDQDLLSLIKDILSHILHIVDLKGINTLILSILTKVIAAIKTLEQSQHRHRTKIFQKNYYAQAMTTILYQVIDIVFLLKNRYREADMILRIVQTTYSLIDCNMLQYADYTLFTRIYSICFDCCLSNSIIQNISASALFALTEIVFASPHTEDCLSILTQLMQYLLGNKKFAWIKGLELKGMVWDLVIIAIRSFPVNRLDQLVASKKITELINKMYVTSIEQAFAHADDNKQVELSKKTEKGEKEQKKIENEKSINFKKGVLADFIRFYKCFVYFSIHLGLRLETETDELVPFKQQLYLFKVLYDLQRSSKLYIFLEGVSLLVIEGSNLLIEEEKGIILLDVFTKIAQELCLASVQIEISWQGGDFYLQKMCGDFSKINDTDFVRLIKNTIIRLRKQLQTKHNNGKQSNGELLSARSDHSYDNDVIDTASKKSGHQKKRWQRLISNIIRIVRYLTSLNMKQGSNDQVLRKLIIELQYWFLICPSNKARNMILQELLNTSSLIDNKQQAIKVSQCLQLGSNIIFAYSESLDNVGLALLVKMLATVKVSWEEGRGFDELDEVCLMADKLYTEQNLITTHESFTKTIQAFVQCANSLLADMQQPNSNEDKTKKVGRNPQDKLIKMIDYVFSKLRAVLQHGQSYVSHEWNFLTGFWISFCSNKSEQVRAKTMAHLQSLFAMLLKRGAVRQQEVLSPYFQLSKLPFPEMPKVIIAHIKQLLVRLTSESAIIEVFAIIKIILQMNSSACLQNDIYELQQMLIKESIFQVKSHDKLISIIESVIFISKDKNEEYKTVSLVWNIADHLKALALTDELKHSEEIWKHLFAKIYSLALHSTHFETKQSCIHALTQMIAQSTAILGESLFFLIMKDTFLQLFYLLMGMQDKSLVLQNGSQVQMTHVAVKNYVKIIKKCQQQKIAHINTLLQLSVSQVLNFITAKGKDISIEYYYQLCLLAEFWSAVKLPEEAGPFDQSNIRQLLLEMEKNHEFFDKTGHLWRKKYEPKFIEIRALFIQQ